MFFFSAPVSFDMFPVSTLLEYLHMCLCQACKVKFATIYVILLDWFPLYPDASKVFGTVVCWLRCIPWNRFTFLITSTLPGIEMKYQIIWWHPFPFSQRASYTLHISWWNCWWWLFMAGSVVKCEGSWFQTWRFVVFFKVWLVAGVWMAVIGLLSMTTSSFSNFTSLFISISLYQFSFSYFNSFSWAFLLEEFGHFVSWFGSWYFPSIHVIIIIISIINFYNFIFIFLFFIYFLYLTMPKKVLCIDFTPSFLGPFCCFQLSSSGLAHDHKHWWCYY